MKVTKRVFAIFMTLALAMSMMITMSAVSFAADDDPITISMDFEEGDTHQYKVYQIFTGDLSGGVLSNVKYGANYGETGNAVPKTVLEGITDADAFARSIYPDAVTGNPVGTLSAANSSVTVDSAGYYLIVDDTGIALTQGDAYSAYIVEVVDTVKVAPKKDTTSGDKIITSDTLGKTETVVNGKIDNVSIGDTVNFKLTGNIPGHATDYDYYYFIIGDTLSEGLTFNSNSVAVTATKTVDGEETVTNLVKDTDYYLYEGEDGYTFQVAMANAKAHAGETITVTYSAVLNEKASIGEEANTNKMEIVYSNNPNSVYDGTQDNDKPGKPDSQTPVPTGKTPEVTTETFTTGIEIQKVDEDGNVLTGAEFTITGDSTEIVLVSSEEFEEAENGEYYGLTDGTYTKEAPVTADRMEPAAEGATKGYVVAESSYEGDDTVTVDGTKYRPFKDGDTGTVYILVKANSDKYNGKRYNKSVTYTQKNTTGEGAVEAKAEVGPDGVVQFVGLGAGTYTIEETKTPAGYNTLAPVTVDITFTANPETGEYHWNKTSGNATYNHETGVFEMTIENQKGSELPETGGIGTMIFYVLGTLLVVGCGIVLISKRRMENR